jgi:hypothetical protein
MSTRYMTTHDRFSIVYCVYQMGKEIHCLRGCSLNYLHRRNGENLYLIEEYLDFNKNFYNFWKEETFLKGIYFNNL